MSKQEASCPAGYQVPVHTQGDWQSGVMMYMQDPQTGMGAHQQGEFRNTGHTLTTELLHGLLCACNSINVPEFQAMRGPAPGSCVTLRTHSRFPVHRLRKVRTRHPTSTARALKMRSGAFVKKKTAFVFSRTGAPRGHSDDREAPQRGLWERQKLQSPETEQPLDR